MAFRDYRVPIEAKTSRAKMLFIGFYFILLIVYGALDMAVNGYWGKELPDWATTYIWPMKTFLGSLGEITVPDYWIFYFQNLVIFFFLLFMMPFVLTRQKRWLIFAVGMSLIAIPLEDYAAQLMSGNIIPNWEGPAKMGWILGIPAFYWYTAIPGFLILFLWTFYEVRMYRMGRRVQKRVGTTIRHPTRILSKGGVSSRRFNNYKPRKGSVKRKRLNVRR